MRERIIGLLLILLTVFILNSNNIDSLKTELETAEGNARVRILNQLSAQMWDKDPEQGLRYAEAALDLVDTEEYTEDLAVIYKSLGINYWAVSKLSLAEDNYFKAKEIYEQLDNEEGLSSILGNLALIYNNRGDFDKAIKYQFDALEIQERLGKKLNMIYSSNNLGLIYSGQEMYEEALSYFLQSYELQKELGLKDNLAYSLNNIGVIYQHLDNNEKSMEYFQQALELEEKYENNVGISALLYNMAKNDIYDGDLDNALDKVERSLSLREDFGDPYKIVESRLRLISILLDQHNYQRVEEELKLAEKMINEHGFIQTKIFLLELNYRYFEQQNQYQQALAKFKRLATLRDSLFTEEKAAQINEMRTKYDVNKKERENEILKINNQIQALKIEKIEARQILYWFLIIIGFLSLFIIYLHYHLKKVANKQLRSKNHLIEKQKQELNQAYEQLQEIDKSKDKFISTMAHDIKNPLVAQISGYRILLSKLENTKDEDTLFITKEMQKNTIHLLSLLDNLLQWSRLQNNRIHYNPSVLDLSDIATRSKDLYKMKADMKGIKIHCSVNEGSLVVGDKEMIISILNNLLTNAIKFSHQESRVEIYTEETDDYLELKVRDHGVGISKEKMEQLFCLDKNISTTGTNNEKGTGLGLILARDFAEKNHGELMIESETGKGTTVIVTLPKYKNE